MCVCGGGGGGGRGGVYLICMLKCEAKIIISISSKTRKCEMLGIHITLQLMLYFHNFNL